VNSKRRKAAIVTGASRGIGKNIALRLAADGFAVAIGYAGNQAQADATVAEIQEKGGTAIAVRGNVAEQTMWQRYSPPRTRLSAV
jgi:3-oxoacyl-[acyl-carrier protein] reductase